MSAPDHDTDVWLLVNDRWIWSCRTCLHKGFADTQAVAEERRRAHGRKPVPWWAEAFR